MPAPFWQPGYIYIPGDIVQPVTAPPVVLDPVSNGNFETGDDTDWTLGPNTAVNGTGHYDGNYGIQFTGNSGVTESVHDPVAVVPGLTIAANCKYQQGAASAGHNPGWVTLRFYDSGMMQLGATIIGSKVDSGSGGAWNTSSVSSTAPSGAAFAAIGIKVDRTDPHASWADSFQWSLTGTVPSSLVYKAVQPTSGVSGPSEPAWPPTVGVQVVDNEVIWEAIDATRVEWTASPVLVSGATEPTFPTTVGNTVNDNTVKWEAVSRRITDPNCPQTKVVAIVGSKVFAADKDIVRFCATANALDWTTQQDAGYLPTGLQQANANDCAVLAPYRGNLCPMNASIFQNWQVDPDPALMALLDQMDGVGSIWQKAAQPVSDDLFYLAALGVRSVGIAGASTNLQSGDVGMPIDPLVRGGVKFAKQVEISPVGSYAPSLGQYWIAFPEYAGPPPAGSVPPSISGSAPDSLVGEVYSYSYTVTEGSSTIVKTVLADGSDNPADFGLSWDEATATVSGTLTAAGAITLVPRVIDASGLSASISDTFNVSLVSYALGLAGGTNYRVIRVIDADDWNRPLLNPGFSCTNIMTGNGGRVMVWSNTNLRYTDDAGVNWTQSASSLGGSGGQRGGARKLGSDIIVIGGGGTANSYYRSANNGTTFTNLTTSKVGILAYLGDRLLTARLGENSLAYSDDDGATAFVAGANHGVNMSNGAGLACSATHAILAGHQSANNNVYCAITTNGTSVTNKLIKTAVGENAEAVAVGYPGDVTRWIIGTNVGEVFVSDDNGTNWDSVWTADGEVTSITWTGASYTLTSYQSSGPTSGGHVYVSDDGITWDEIVSTLTGRIYGVTVSDG